MNLMPHNWDDHAQWDVYFEAYRREKMYLDPMIVDGDMVGTRFVPAFTRAGWRKIWVPGCGASLLPSLLTAFGFEVWASDVSKVAVQIQGEMQQSGIPSPEIINKAKGKFKPEELPTAADSVGTLHIIQHDLRTPFVETDFDCILNIRAFQGLPSDTMAEAAKIHWNALAPAQYAFFDTMNVQGEQRNQIEKCLADAGFYVPRHAADEWYRKALDETGIPFVMILGNPFPYRGDERYNGENGDDNFQVDRIKLRSFGEEYMRRRTEEAAQNEHLFTDGNTKIAHIIYNTG